MSLIQSRVHKGAMHREELFRDAIGLCIILMHFQMCCSKKGQRKQKYQHLVALKAVIHELRKQQATVPVLIHFCDKNTLATSNLRKKRFTNVIL